VEHILIIVASIAVFISGLTCCAMLLVVRRRSRAGTPTKNSVVGRTVSVEAHHSTTSNSSQCAAWDALPSSAISTGRSRSSTAASDQFDVASEIGAIKQAWGCRASAGDAPFTPPSKRSTADCPVPDSSPMCVDSESQPANTAEEVHVTSPSSTLSSQTSNCEVAVTPTNETKLQAAQVARRSHAPPECLANSPSSAPTFLGVYEQGEEADGEAQRTAMQHIAMAMLAKQQDVQVKATAARAASRLKARAVANAAKAAEQARGEVTDLEQALSAFIRPAMRPAATPERCNTPIRTPAAELVARAASRVARAQASNGDADLRI